MMQEMADRKLNYEISVRGLFVSFITELMRQPAQGSTGTPMGSMVIAPALTYINNHYMDNFTICDLADVCNMSQSHFRRVFHELMGIGPLEHLNRTRITKACSLLRMTDESILTSANRWASGRCRASTATLPRRWAAPPPSGGAVSAPDAAPPSSNTTAG